MSETTAPAEIVALRGVLGRVIAAREELAVGERLQAAAILADLEADLVALADCRIERAAS